MQQVQRSTDRQAVIPSFMGYQAFPFAVCVLLSKVMLMEAVSPLAAAFCIACSLMQKGALAAAAGCIAGSVLFYDTPYALTLCIGITCAAGQGISLALKKQVGEKITLLLAVAGGLAALIIFNRYAAYTMLTTGLEIVLAVVLGYTFKNALMGLGAVLRRTSLSEGEALALCAAYCCLLMSVADLQVMEMNMMRVLAIASAVVVAAGTSLAMAAGVGIALGFSLSMAGDVAPICIGSMGVCAMAGGACRKAGRPGAFAGFALCNALLTLYINRSTQVILPLPEIVLAGGLALLVPRRVMDIVSATLHAGGAAGTGRAGNQLMQDMAATRLTNISVAMEAAAQALEERVQPMTRKDENIWAAKRLAIGCRGCPKRVQCWEQNAEANIAISGRMLRHYLHDGTIVLYKEMAEDCMDTNRLTENAKQAFEAISYERNENGRLRVFRDTTATHLKEISNITGHLAQDIVKPDEMQKLEDTLADKMRMLGLDVFSVAARDDALGRLRIRLELSNAGKECEQGVVEAASQASGRKMRLNAKPVRNKEGMLLFTLHETSRLSLKAGASAVKREGSQISGDHYSICKLDDGRYFACLCDGMGSGKEAATSGRIGTKLIEAFFRAGYDQTRIMEAVNSVMAMSGNDVFTTADVCIIDLIDKSCEFIKSGAAPSFLIRGHKMEVLSGEALPIGVVEDAHPSCMAKKLKAGDIILLLSDGVTDCLDEEMKHAILDMTTQDAKAISQEIIRVAMQRVKGKHDDMTAIVLKID